MSLVPRLVIYGLFMSLRSSPHVLRSSYPTAGRPFFLQNAADNRLSVQLPMTSRVNQLN